LSHQLRFDVDLQDAYYTTASIDKNLLLLVSLKYFKQMFMVWMSYQCHKFSCLMISNTNRVMLYRVSFLDYYFSFSIWLIEWNKKVRWLYLLDNGAYKGLELVGRRTQKWVLVEAEAVHSLSNWLWLIENYCYYMIMIILYYLKLQIQYARYWHDSLISHENFVIACHSTYRMTCFEWVHWVLSLKILCLYLAY
jgi:hypothetical protein